MEATLSSSTVPVSTNDNNNRNTPSDANVGCVGPSAESAGKASACEGCPNQTACASGAYNSPEAQAKAQQEEQQLQMSLANVSHVILVLSGKGGVGKSTVASQLCFALANEGYAVGLLDVDLCGPSAPRMVLGDASLQAQVHKSGSGAWTPVYATTKVNHNTIAVMSISFLLEDHDAAVVWRGPRKNGLIQQFLTQVDWTGDTEGLDYLIVDTPPGTSDEHISTVQYLQKANAISGAVVVTTPEEISMADVRKELSFCQKTKVPVLGLIENMSSYQTTMQKLSFFQTVSNGNDNNNNNSDDDDMEHKDCTTQVLQLLQEKCPEVLTMTVSANIFPTRSNTNNTTTTTTTTTTIGPKAMATHYNIDYWGKLPLDPDLVTCCETGQSFVETFPTAMGSKFLQSCAKRIADKLPVE